MIIAAIPRAAGQLVVALENHPRSGESIIVISHVQADESVVHRTALQPAELSQVIAALTLASQTLQARRPQHRTVRASAPLDDEGLF
jgi:hypothetical protein